ALLLRISRSAPKITIVHKAVSKAIESGFAAPPPPSGAPRAGAAQSARKTNARNRWTSGIRMIASGLRTPIDDTSMKCREPRRATLRLLSHQEANNQCKER